MPRFICPLIFKTQGENTTSHHPKSPFTVTFSTSNASRLVKFCRVSPADCHSQVSNRPNPVLSPIPIAKYTSLSSLKRLFTVTFPASKASGLVGIHSVSPADHHFTLSNRLVPVLFPFRIAGFASLSPSTTHLPPISTCLNANKLSQKDLVPLPDRQLPVSIASNPSNPYSQTQNPRHHPLP